MPPPPRFFVAKVTSSMGGLNAVATTVGGFAMAKLEDAGLISGK